MAGMNVPMNRQASRQMGASAPVRAPRLLMSWEDWLTFIAAFITFVSVAVSIQNADWVRNFPALVPTAICALLIGMVAARVRLPGIIVHPVAIVLGAVVVVLAVQGYADGATLAERLDDFQARMYEWYQVVKANDISNDNLPFVTLVHSVSFLAVYIGSFAIYKWHNPWIALFPAAVVLLANISFLDGHPSGAFVVFLFGAILLVSRLHLQKSQALWKKAGIDYPDFISVSTVQLTVAVAIGLMLVAWLVPLGTQAKVVEGVYNKVTAPFDNENDRLVRLFHNIDSRKGANLHTFGSTLPIEGSVKLGTKQLLEVSASEPGLIRATSYEEYTGAGWKTADRDRERVDGGTLAASPEVAQYEKRNAAPLEVKVLDEAGTVLSAGMPLGSNRDVTIETPEGYRGDIEQIKLRRGLGDGDTYTSIGSQSVATEEELRSAPDEYPDWVKDRYLQLPDDLPQRVHDEATRVIAEAGASNQYDAAAAIEAYLRTFPYDLNVEAAPPNRDIVDFFLFDQKRGYFDWHATAMTVMLRTAGIPARIAVGYALDPADAKDGTYIVRKDDAYSWVEVWFPKYGWIEFNPTPNKPSGGAGGIGSAAPDPGDALSGVDLGDLFGPSIDPSLLPPGDLPLPINEALNEEPVDHSEPPWTLIWGGVAVLTVLVAGFIGARLTWNWGLGGLDGRARLWAKAHRVAGWAGLGSHPEETPREWSQRVGAVVAKEPEARRLAEAYEEAKYGRPDQQRIPDEEAESSYKQLRNSLFAKVWRRKDADGKPRRRKK